MKYGDADWLDAQYRRTKVDPWGLDWRPTQIYRQELMLRMLRDHLGSREGALRIIDVGCATGEFTHRLAGLNPPAGARVLGIDIAEQAVARARQRHPGVEFECAGLRQAAAQWANHADCLTCLEVLYYVAAPERAAAVQDLAAMLRPGGMLLVSSMIARPPYLSLDELLALISPGFRIVHAGRIHLRQAGQLEKLLMRLGIARVGRLRRGAGVAGSGEAGFDWMRRVDAACARWLGDRAASHAFVIARKSAQA